MGYGGYHPYPRRFGGSAGSDLEVIHASLNDNRGTALDAGNPDSIAWLENMAIARALAFDGWGSNQRLALQWDPRRTTDMLDRWENIFSEHHPPGTPDAFRRRALTRRWQRFGKRANHGALIAALQDALGSFFVALEYTSVANAVVHVPDGSYPWGTVVDGIQWYSTVAHVLVRLQKPSGESEAAFYEAAGKVVEILDPRMSSWVTFDWYRAPAGGTPIDVVGGPSAGGFYLDDEHNLDNNVFDV